MISVPGELLVTLNNQMDLEVVLFEHFVIPKRPKCDREVPEFKGG